MAKLLSDDELFGTSAAPQTKLLSDDEVTSDGGSTNRSAGDWLKDLGIAGVQGGLGLEQSVAGLLRYSPLARANQLATGVNPVDVALTAGKFEPEQWTKQLEQQKSPQAQQANQAVQQAQGVGGTLSALAEHPEYIPDQVVQSAPGTMMAGRMARGAAESVLPALQSGVKAIAAKAGTYVAGVGGMMEGAQQSGQMLDKAREQGQSPDEIAPYAAGAGLVDALIVGLASKIPGFKDASMSIAEAGLGATRAGKMVAAKEVAKTAFSEGVLEELPQSMQEQIFQNLADGKPWDEGVANAGVIGAVVGGIQGGGAHLYQQGRDALVRTMQEKMPKIKLGTEDIGNYSDEELTEFLHDDMIPAEAKVKAAVELQRRAKPEVTQFPAYGTVPADAATPEASAPAAPPVQPNGAIDDAIARLEQERGIAGQPGDGSGEQRNLGAGSPGNVGVAGQPDGAGAVGGAGSAQGGVQSPVVPAALGGQAPVAVGERQTLLQGAQPVQGVPVPSDPRSEIEHIGEQLNVLNDLQRQDEMKAAQAPAVPNPGQTQQLGLPQPTFRPLEQVAQAMWDQTRKWDNAQLVEQGKAQPLPQTADEIYLRGLNHVLQQRAAVIEAATGQRPPLLRPVSDPQVAKSWERLASALQDLTGIRPIAYEDNTRGAPRGFELSGRPHVNLAQAELPAVYVAMHELKHVAERAAEDYHNDDGKLVHGNQDAKAITSMIHSVFDLIDPEFKRQYATQYLWKSSPQADGTFLVNGQRLTLEQVLDHPTLRSEMTADFMGQRAADPAFWDSLAKRKPATFGEFVKGWLRTLRFLIGKLKGYRGKDNINGVKPGSFADVERHIKDLQKAHRIAEDAMLRWAKAVKAAREAGGHLREMDEGSMPSFKRADEPNDTAKSRPTSDVGHKRRTTDGTYIGAPDWVRKPSDILRLRNQLRKLAKEGEVGRHWYEQSSRAILDTVGGDKEEAKRLVQLIAIYSPNATVPANTSMALTAYWQWKAGLPIKAGFGMNNKKAEELLRQGKEWSGIKTNSFYQNLMVGIDPSELDPGVATMDMWMALAFDYGSKKLADSQYRFAERETRRLGDELGWTAHQVQAAVWTAIKAKVEASAKDRKAIELANGIGHMVDNPATGKPNFEVKKGRERDHFKLATELALKTDVSSQKISEAARDFSHALNDRTLQLSWEATPGASTGVLPGMLHAQVSQKFEYLLAIQDKLSEDGKDRIAELVGVPQGKAMIGYSAWQGDIGASAQQFIPAPVEGAAGRKAWEIKPEAQKQLGLYAAVRGYVLAQESVVYHMPLFDAALSNHNGWELRSPRPLSGEEVDRLYHAIHEQFGTWDLAPAYRPNGVRVLNYTDVSNKDFHAGMAKVMESMPDGFGGGGLTAATFKAIGDYISNDWKESPRGEGYLRQIEAERPDLLGAVQRLKAGVQAVNEEFDRRYGWGNPRFSLGEDFAKLLSDAEPSNEELKKIEAEFSQNAAFMNTSLGGDFAKLDNALDYFFTHGAFPDEVKKAEDAVLPKGSKTSWERPSADKVLAANKWLKDHGIGKDNLTVELAKLWLKKVGIANPDEEFGYTNQYDYGDLAYELGLVHISPRDRMVVLGGPNTPEFKAWFGKSKMVDADGSPNVMYHGTARDISVFKAKQAGAIFVTPSPKFSDDFASMSKEWMDMNQLSKKSKVLGLDEVKEIGLEAKRAIAADYATNSSIGKEYVKEVDRFIEAWEKDDPSVYGTAGIGFNPEVYDYLTTASRRKVPHGPTIMPMFVKAENPFDFNDKAQVLKVTKWIDAEAEEKLGQDNKTVFYRINSDDAKPGFPKWASLDMLKRQIEAGDWTMIESDTVQQAIKALGHDSFHMEENGTKNLAVYDPSQLKSATGNSGAYSARNPDIRFSRPLSSYVPNNPTATVAWQIPAGKIVGKGKVTFDLDNFIYEMQDKHVDLRRLVDTLDKISQVKDDFNPDLGETLYHGRVGQRTADFLDGEARPLAKLIVDNGLEVAGVEDYLLARHAPERNAQVAKINPGMPDGGAGTNSKGVLMTTAAAKAYIATLPADQKAKLQAVATEVDKIIKGTQDLLVSSGLEKQSTINAWNAAYQNYVPLFKDEANEESIPHPIGKGFSVKGQASKRAMGSKEKVTNVLAHVVMAREAAITRAEKNRVWKRMYALALSHPNPDFWTVDKPPTIRMVSPSSGLVMERIDPMYKSAPEVLVGKVFGEDRIITFNMHDQRAARLASAMKNLDSIIAPQLATSIAGKMLKIMRGGTHWVAAVNTQYNVVFGLSNFARDMQTAMFNLSTTPLAGKQKQVLGNALPAIRGILAQMYGQGKNNKWSQLFDQFAHDGGTTGYRDLFINPEDRAKQIIKEMNQYRRSEPVKWAYGMLDLLDHYNTAIENGVRLSAYKAALDIGMSREKAAELAKNLTVNFNRKGRVAQAAGVLYAFFNASAQGSARLIETLKGPRGKAIIAGGLMLGVLQGFMFAAAGLDDEDELSEYTKSRNLIIPLYLFGAKKEDKKYIMVPMAMGFNLLPTIGRQLFEASKSPKKLLGKNIMEIMASVLDSFNPLGGQSFAESITPTMADPIIEINANKDFKGDPIYNADHDPDNPAPGFTRFRKSAWDIQIKAARAINKVTGGTDYTPGLWSPTPEELSYYVNAVGGGVTRELGKLADAIGAAFSDTKKADPNRVPVVGRFYGEVNEEQSQTRKYYNDMKELSAVKREVKGRARDGADYEEVLRDNPAGAYYAAYDKVGKAIGKLSAMRKDEVLKKSEGWEQRVADYDKEILQMREELNKEYEAAKKAQDAAKR